MNMIKDINGKVSTGRVLSIASFVFACSVSVFSIVMASVTNNATTIAQTVPVVVAFLTFAGGVKVGGGFVENKKK